MNMHLKLAVVLMPTIKSGKGFHVIKYTDPQIYKLLCV